MTAAKGRDREHWEWAKRKYFSSKRIQTMPRLAAAKELDVGKSSIARWAKEGGIPTPEYRADEKRKNNVASLLASKEFGLSEKQSQETIPFMAIKFHITQCAVYKAQKENGVSPLGYSKDRNRKTLYLLTKSAEDIPLVKLASEWHRPPGMTKHLESLRDD